MFLVGAREALTLNLWPSAWSFHEDPFAMPVTTLNVLAFLRTRALLLAGEVDSLLSTTFWHY